MDRLTTCCCHDFRNSPWATNADYLLHSSLTIVRASIFVVLFALSVIPFTSYTTCFHMIGQENVANKPSICPGGVALCGILPTTRNERNNKQWPYSNRWNFSSGCIRKGDETLAGEEQPRESSNWSFREKEAFYDTLQITEAVLISCVLDLQ